MLKLKHKIRKVLRTANHFQYMLDILNKTGNKHLNFNIKHPSLCADTKVYIYIYIYIYMYLSVNACNKCVGCD
jgi:hypothetical protein